MYKPTDPLMGPNRGDLGLALKVPAKQNPDFILYANELFRLCQLPDVNLDFGALFSQWAEETASGTSTHWSISLNPAGLEIFSDGSAPIPRFKSGVEAARAHVVDMAFRVHNGRLPASLTSFAALDPHLAALKAANYAAGTFDTIDSLSGRWATDSQYGANICACANTLFPKAADVPAVVNPIVFGRVPRPLGFTENFIVKSQAWDDLGPRVIRGFVLHRMLGTLEGTNEYFGNQALKTALTDFGVGPTGKIYNWNDLNGRRAPWASGPWNSPGEGDATKFVRDHGIDAINRDLTAIEFDGLAYTSPVSEAMFEAACQLAAWVADQRKFRWDKWPVNPFGDWAVYWHHEFTTLAVKACPGPIIEALTDRFITRVGQILKQYQNAVAIIPKPVPVEPVPFQFTAKELSDRFGGVLFEGKYYGYDAKGPVSTLWLATAKKTGLYPQLTRITATPKGQLCEFSNGLAIIKESGQPARLA